MEVEMSASADDSAVMLCVDGSHLDHISEEMLLDGGLVSIRRLDLDDLDGVIALSETLTESERYFRFFTAYPSCLNNWARSLAERSDRQFALGAFESGRLIGVASYFMCNEPGCAEVAIVVAHQEHMRGVGTVLLGRLGQIARDNGVNRFVADVLAENYLMRKVMSDAGWPCTIHADGSELRVDVNLAELAQ
jgi:RimJ/RimL family protein N-acetyltransferase